MPHHKEANVLLPAVLGSGVLKARGMVRCAIRIS